MNANANINESKKKGRPVYLDYQATTPMDPRVVEAMAPFFGDKFGNPHSRNHFYGWEAEEAVEKARRQIAETFAAFLVQQVDGRRRHGESLQAIDQNCAIVMVAGINELILHTLIDDRAHTLMELAPVAVDIINRFVMPPA